MSAYEGRFAGRTAVVTGGASGLGKASAARIIAEGGKVYACRFALQALYGHGEGALIEGIRPINPLDVLDLVLIHRKANAFILDTWTL